MRVAFDVRSRGVGLDYQTGFLEQFVACWTSRRTETLAPTGIAWISAVAFMGLEVKGLTWYRAALTAAYHAGVRPPSTTPLSFVNLSGIMTYGITRNAKCSRFHP